MTHEIALTKVKVPITEGPWKKMLTDWALDHAEEIMKDRQK